MKLLVSGAREGFDPDRLELVLNFYLEDHGPKLVIIEGCAAGVDTQAYLWALKNHVPVLHYPAPWQHLGKRAGAWRNRAMLASLQPDGVLCFHHDLSKSRGTRDMYNEAQRRGIPTALVTR